MEEGEEEEEDADVTLGGGNQWLVEGDGRNITTDQ